MADRIVEWGWSLVLLALGAVTTLFTRWISMLHKHERQLAIIEHEQQNRVAATNAIVASVAEVNTRLEVHRRESMDRFDTLRRDLKDDFKTLIEFHSRSEERDRTRE